MTVVIFAQDCDAPVVQVIQKLTEREVPVFRADTSWFPQRLAIDARLESERWVGCLSTDHHRVDLDDIRSIWYRDPSAFDFPANLTHPERRFAFREARREALVIIVGDRIFPILIHAGSAASRVDWRTDYAALQYELTGIPVTVEDGIRRYMAAFGLVYAAFDFAIDAAEKWFFLEANTAGQYGFLETNTGAPISNALVDLLTGGTARG